MIIWDPSQLDLVDKIEKVQRHFLRLCAYKLKINNNNSFDDTSIFIN